MTQSKTYQVKQVAQITGVSVRTLHYYDEIGLLTPSERTAAGYRLYDENDLLRLQQVLIGRSLGLALEEIRLSLDDPKFEYAKSLHRQRALLIERIGDAHKMIAAIDTTLAGLSEAERPIDFGAVFDGFDPNAFEEETQQRWGETDAYKQSAARTRAYSDADWTLLKSELDTIWRDAAQEMQQGSAPDSDGAQQIVDRHRNHICRWFYDLTPEAHAGLAQMWEVDDRFRANIDKHGEGLTAWLANAVRAAAQTD